MDTVQTVFDRTVRAACGFESLHVREDAVNFQLHECASYICAFRSLPQGQKRSHRDLFCMFRLTPPARAMPSGMSEGVSGVREGPRPFLSNGRGAWQEGLVPPVRRPRRTKGTERLRLSNTPFRAQRSSVRFKRRSLCFVFVFFQLLSQHLIRLFRADEVYDGRARRTNRRQRFVLLVRISDQEFV